MLFVTAAAMMMASSPKVVVPGTALALGAVTAFASALERVAGDHLRQQARSR